MFVKESLLPSVKINLKEAWFSPLGYASTNMSKRASVWSMLILDIIGCKTGHIFFLF